MFLRASLTLWRILAEFSYLLTSAFQLSQSCENVRHVQGGMMNVRLKRIPSLLRGLVPFGAAPVLLPVRPMAERMHSPFPKNLPLPVNHMGSRPKRTEHV